MMGTARRIDRPEPGFFRMRLVRGGPWVPAVTFLPCPIDPHTGEQLDRARKLMGSVNGEDPSYAVADRVWISGRPISEREFLFLLADGQWCRDHAPDLPEANPTKSINLREIAPITP